MRVINIIPTGNVGNQMFQYMFARRLQAMVPDSRVVGYAMDMWSLRCPAELPLPDEAITITGGHKHDVRELISHLTGGPDRVVNYEGFGQRLEYYGSPRETAKLFTPPEALDVPIFGDNHLVINVRGNEILRAIHVHMTPVPLSFYARLIADTGLQPIFMGQVSNDFYSDALRSAFPAATFLPSMGPIKDFETVRRATHIAISVSTFSWLAAWLSEAKTIHMPVVGLYHPEQVPVIDLIPKADPRYRFYPYPVRWWSGSEEDRRFVLALES